MEQTTILVLFGVIIVIVLFILFYRKKEPYEGIIGAASKYRNQYSNCLHECRNEDPSRRMDPMVNLGCTMYCDSTVTDLTRRGVDPRDIIVRDTTSDCIEMCTIPGYNKEEVDECISKCSGITEVAKWCAEMECPHSLLPKKECMNSCIATMNANNSSVEWTRPL